MPEPVALGIKVPDAMGTLSSVMGAAQGMQNLQRQRIETKRSGIGLQQEQMDLQERQALRGLAQNMDQFKTEGGDPDYPKLIEAATKVAPKLGMEFVKNVAGSHVTSIAARQGLQNLSEDQRAAIGKVVQSVAELPLDKQLAAINAVVEGNPTLKPWGDLAAKRLSAVAQERDPKKLTETAYRLAQATTSVAEQTGAKTGSRISTGGEIVQASPVATALGAAAAPIPATLPIAQREEVSTNPVTQMPIVTKRNAQGHVTEVSGAPTGAGVPQLQPGDPQAIPILTQQRSAVNQAAAKVPEQRFNNKQIIALAPAALAGTGGDALTKLGSTIGIQMVAGDQPGNMQRLAHFMALQAQANAQAMGAGTDQARSIAEQASGSTKWTPEAIISTAKVNDALSTGVDLFNRGMEKAISSKGGNVLAVRDFQNAWSQNFDPQAVMLHNAIQSKDAKEVEKIVKSVGGKGSAGAHQLAAKLKNMETLVQKGGL